MRRAIDAMPPPGLLAIVASVVVSASGTLSSVSDFEIGRVRGSAQDVRSSGEGITPAVIAGDEVYNPDLSLILARPLFQEGRRQPLPEQKAAVAEVPAAPVAETAPLPDSPPPPLPPLAMVGFREMGGGPEVLLRHPDSGVEAWYRVGGEIGGWMITAIDRDRVHIRSGALEMTIQMFE